MKKSYYFLFGSSIENINDLARILYDKLDLQFQLHESEYVGAYLKYTGIYSDKISIENNFNKKDNTWKEKKFKHFPTLIYVSNLFGKNADKRSKSQYIKTMLQKIEGIQLLKEEIIETND